MGVSKVHSGRRYRLTNVLLTDRVLDLSTLDKRSIIWHTSHGGDSQKWEFLETNDGWYIRNVSMGLYASVEGPRNSKNEYASHTRVVGSQEPYKWEIYLEQGPALEPVFRLQVPESDKRLEFCKFGENPDGIVCPYDVVGSGIHQRWDLTEIKKVLVIAGISNNIEDGVAIGRLFAKEGYAIAILDTHSDPLKRLKRELSSMPGIEVATFPLQSYSTQTIIEAWKSVKARFDSSSYEIRASIWNSRRYEPRRFLDITPEEAERSTQVNVVAAIAFARQAVIALSENASLQSESRKYGTLIFTGNSRGLEANVFTSPFSSFQCALRSLSQTLNKEFGDEKIHVAHIILDDFISTNRSQQEEYEEIKLRAESMAKSYLHLIGQDISAWTWELDLRPAQSYRTRASGSELFT